jgi:hypothetical protein
VIHHFFTYYLLEHIFEKKNALLNSLTLSVRLCLPSLCSSVCYLFFRHLSTFDLQILDSKRRLSISEEYGWVFRSKAQRSGIELRLGPSQIKVFNLYFINFSETINVCQLISQGYSRIQLFQKKIFPWKHWKKQLVVAPI